MGGYLSEKRSGINPTELLRETKQLLRNLQGKICRGCKEIHILYQSGLCKECWLNKYQENLQKNKERRLVGKDGYVRRYTDDGRLIYEHRMVMEAMLGRELKKEEVIQWLDGDRTNNDPSNLVLALKTGIPFSRLKCDCGCDGQIIVIDPVPT